MIKVGLNIKNSSKAIKPTKGDIVIFDGKDWYVTTKEDILKEYREKLAEINQKLQEMEQFKREISAQIKEMSEIIKKFVKLQGEE